MPTQRLRQFPFLRSTMASADCRQLHHDGRCHRAERSWPTQASNTVTTDEDYRYTFAAGDFNFADIDGDRSSVKVTSLRRQPELVNGSDVTLNQVISRRTSTPACSPLPRLPMPAARLRQFRLQRQRRHRRQRRLDPTMTVDVTAVNDIADRDGNTFTHGRGFDLHLRCRRLHLHRCGRVTVSSASVTISNESLAV